MRYPLNSRLLALLATVAGITVASTAAPSSNTSNLRQQFDQAATRLVDLTSRVGEVEANIGTEFTNLRRLELMSQKGTNPDVIARAVTAAMDRTGTMSFGLRDLKASLLGVEDTLNRILAAAKEIGDDHLVSAVELQIAKAGNLGVQISDAQADVEVLHRRLEDLLNKVKGTR